MNATTRKKAEELMRVFVQCQQNKKALQDTISNELKAYDENMKDAQTKLIELGEKHKDEFDKDGNFDLGKGYLHIVNSTVVVTGRKFDLASFNQIHPEFVDFTLKKGEIKKAFNDKELRKELIGLGVQTDNEQSMQVLAYKEKI